MKKFSFPLARVLDLRRTQARIEETKLERLHAELRALQDHLEAARKARAGSTTALVAGGSVTGAELAALDHYRKALAVESVRLAGLIAALRRRIAEQMQAVIRKRRDVKLLEHLHDARFAEWTHQWQREIDREAAELHLFKSRAR